MKILGKILFFGVIAAGVGYTVSYLKKQASLIKDYEISVARVKVNSFSFTKVSLTLFLEFWNKSNLSIDLISQKYKVYMNNKPVADLVNNKLVTIKPKAKTIIPLNVTFDFSKVLKLSLASLRDLLENKNKIKIRTVGSIKIKSSLLFVNNFPIDFTYTLQELLDLAKKK